MFDLVEGGREKMNKGRVRSQENDGREEREYKFLLIQKMKQYTGSHGSNSPGQNMCSLHSERST